MDWFEEFWNDKSFWPYQRDNLDAVVYSHIKGYDKSPSANKKTTERSNYMPTDIRGVIKNVKFNPPATIVFWTDNTKTVVKCNGEDYDPEKGLAMCICKKMLGNKGNYYEFFKKWLPKRDDSDITQKVLQHIEPQTFEFQLKPIDINQRLFDVLTGVPSAATIKFDKKKEESEPRSCHTCKLYDPNRACCVSNKVCVDHKQWASKDE